MPTFKYSSGMRVRLILAMGLLIDNPIYLMDEPFVGLDPLTVREIRRFVKEEFVGKRTILLATHILADVEELCDRVVLMDEGKIVAVGTIPDLKRNIRGIEVIDSDIQVDDRDALVEAINSLNGIVICTFSSPSTDAAITSARVHTHDSRNLLLANTFTSTFSGATFPVEIIQRFVPWLYPISMILPQTHALSAVRLNMSGVGLANLTVQLNIAYMLSFSLLIIPIGVKLTNKGIDRIRREGYSPPSGGEVII